MLLTKSERNASARLRREAVKECTRMALERANAARLEFSKQIRMCHNKLQERLKKQRTDRYLGRGVNLAYEREFWMNPERSAQVQLIEKASSATLMLTRYGIRTKKTKVGFKIKYSMTGHRYYAFANQGGKCYFCKRDILFEKWTIDHLMPLSRGGGNEHDNLKGACSTCNNAKGSLTEEEFQDTGYIANLGRYGAAMAQNKRNRFIAIRRNIIVKTKYQSVLPNPIPIDLQP